MTNELQKAGRQWQAIRNQPVSILKSELLLSANL
jgi:hypothetical protein